MSAKIIQFPSSPSSAKALVAGADAAGRPAPNKSANPFDADYRSAIICEALFGERK